jgi:hypothetical protein
MYHKEYTKNREKKRKQNRKNDSTVARRLTNKKELNQQVQKRKGGESIGHRTPIIENSQKKELKMRQR